MELPYTLVEDETRVDALFPAIDKLDDGGVFVELGTFLGGNLIRCIQYAKSKGKNIKFFAVDNWKFENISEEGKKNINKDYLQTFLDNLAAAGYDDVVYVISDSAEAAKQFPDNHIDILFVDDDHNYPKTKEVLTAWIPKVKAGGLIAGHDYPCGGVQLAVKECLDDEFTSNGHSYWKRL